MPYSRWLANFNLLQNVLFSPVFLFLECSWCCPSSGNSPICFVLQLNSEKISDGGWPLSPVSMVCLLYLTRFGPNRTLVFLPTHAYPEEAVGRAVSFFVLCFLLSSGTRIYISMPWNFWLFLWLLSCGYISFPMLESPRSTRCLNAKM